MCNTFRAMSKSYSKKVTNCPEMSPSDPSPTPLTAAPNQAQYPPASQLTLTFPESSHTATTPGFWGMHVMRLAPADRLRVRTCRTGGEFSSSSLSLISSSSDSSAAFFPCPACSNQLAFTEQPHSQDLCPPRFGTCRIQDIWRPSGGLVGGRRVGVGCRRLVGRWGGSNRGRVMFACRKLHTWMRR